MAKKNNNDFLQQLRQVIKDGLDYLQSLLLLLQARTAEFLLSGVLFVFLIILAFLFGLTALILFNVVIGIWLSQVLGNPVWAVLILAGSYALLAVLAGYKAMKWVRTLKS